MLPDDFTKAIRLRGLRKRLLYTVVYFFPVATEKCHHFFIEQPCQDRECYG